MLLVLIVGITRLETVESFPSHDSFSSTSAVANISQEKHLKSFGFVERLHRRSINDCQRTADTIATRGCATISSVFQAGYSWEVANGTNDTSIELSKSWSKRVWFVWLVYVNGYSVFMFGLNSRDKPGKYHFVINLGNSTLMLSEPLCQPENNLPIIDKRCFETLSSNKWRHAETGLFVTDKDKKVVLTEEIPTDFDGQYRLDPQNEC